MSQPLSLAAQSLLNGLDGTAYVVDSERCFVAIGAPNWRKFAESNDGAALADERELLGRPLMDFIRGHEVRANWLAALDRLDKGAVASVVMPYRCDSPSVHRDMRMAVTAFDDAGRRYFLFHSVTLAERMRPPISVFDVRGRPAGSADGPLPLVAMCSFCHSLRPGEQGEEWVSPEAYYVGGGTSLVDITHSVCPDCHGEWFRSLGLPVTGPADPAPPPPAG